MIALLRTKYFYYVIHLFFILLILANNSLKAEQELKIISDELLTDKEKNTINAKGDVYISTEEISSRANNVIYKKWVQHVLKEVPLIPDLRVSLADTWLMVYRQPTSSGTRSKRE